MKIKEASLFDLFIVKLFDSFEHKVFTKREATERLSITSNQLDEWLKTGIEKEFIIKNNKPVSYKLNPNKHFKVI